MKNQFAFLLISFLLLSPLGFNFGLADEIVQGEERGVLHSCLSDLTPKLIKEIFGDSVLMGDYNFCHLGDSDAREGEIFIFGYGHGRPSKYRINPLKDGDVELCIGQGCAMGRQRNWPFVAYGGITNKDDFVANYLSKRIAGAKLYQLDIFRGRSSESPNRQVGGYYLKKNAVVEKMVCFIYQGHGIVEKKRLLSECSARWLEKKQPMRWIDSNGEIVKEIVQK